MSSHTDHNGLEADTSFEQFHLPACSGGVPTSQDALIDPTEVVIVTEVGSLVRGR